MVSSFIALISVCILCLWFLECSASQWEPVVTTSLGKIRGSISKTEKGNDFYAFRGIRYAEAPIGEKRFKAPLAVSKWKGEFNATQDGSKCPQNFMAGELMNHSEDCLFLNVYTRKLKGAKVSVIVVIHGGYNVQGSGDSLSGLGPRYLLDKDIVLVTFNYRLGPFGFLCLNSDEASGNYAFVDQLMVLQFVRSHIADFGGNPESVTLVGSGSGGMAATIHMASPMSKGLFHKAIVMSASATSDIVLDNVKWSRKLAHELSCPMFNATDVLNCLRNRTWEAIINVCASWEYYDFPNLKWGYHVDGQFMEAKVTDIFHQGNFTKIPILTGLTKDELTYSIFTQEQNMGLFNDVSMNFEKYAPEFFLHEFDRKKLARLEKFYLGKRPINDQNLTNFGEIFSDSLVGYSVHRLVDLARKYVDVYYYRFDYSGRFGNLIVAEDGKPREISHGDDLMYFLSDETIKFTIYDPEWFMVERMVGMISSFAQNGFPQDMNDTKWLPTNRTELNTMYINTNAHLGYEPFTERFRLWDELFPINSSNCLTKINHFILVLVVLVNILYCI